MDIFELFLLRLIHLVSRFLSGDEIFQIVDAGIAHFETCFHRGIAEVGRQGYIIEMQKIFRDLRLEFIDVQGGAGDGAVF